MSSGWKGSPFFSLILSGGKEHCLHFWCPGCERYHLVIPKEFVHNNGPKWTVDPVAHTVSPSILVTKGPSDPKYRCHLFIRGGNIEYLRDCSHHLKGKTVPLVKFDEAPY